MTQPNNNIQNYMNRLTSTEPQNIIQSLNNISKVIFAFTLLFIATYFFKLFKIEDASTKHFRLIFNHTDILPLYKINLMNFIFLSAYEITKLSIIALTFFYFIKFLNSLNMSDPFANIKSKTSISYVATLSILFFSVDAIGALHQGFMGYFKDTTMEGISTHIFHFEYLFLAYFINVFAIIFKRGVDLKNEIDLVI